MAATAYALDGSIDVPEYRRYKRESTAQVNHINEVTQKVGDGITDIVKLVEDGISEIGHLFVSSESGNQSGQNETTPH